MLQSRFAGFCLLLFVIFSGASCFGAQAGCAPARAPDQVPRPQLEQPAQTRFTLKEVIEIALKNNPALRQSEKDAGIEEYGRRSAAADRLPKVDFSSGVTEFRYPTPVSPISGIPKPGSTAGFPEFSNTITDFGLSFKLPLYRGGRLDRAVRVAELRKGAAEDTLARDTQEVIFNATSVFHKIAQLDRLREANEASAKQLALHKRNVEQFLQAGTAPRVDLLKTEVELAHASENVLVVKNNLENTIEILRSVMGLDDLASEISIVPETSKPRTGTGQNRTGKTSARSFRLRSIRPKHGRATRFQGKLERRPEVFNSHLRGREHCGGGWP